MGKQPVELRNHVPVDKAESLYLFSLVCSIPFLLARLRGVNPRIDRFMDSAGRWMHADPPSTYKGSKQPASKQFLRSLKSTQYVGPADVEAAIEGGFCGNLIRPARVAEAACVAVPEQLTPLSAHAVALFGWNFQWQIQVAPR